MISPGMRHFVCVGGDDVEDRTDRSQNREAKGVVVGQAKANEGINERDFVVSGQTPKYIETGAEAALG